MSERLVPARRPFHETIVDAIKRCPHDYSTKEIFRLLELIEETKIPEGHEEIIKSIDRYFSPPEKEKFWPEINGVKESLREQAEACKKSEEENK